MLLLWYHRNQVLIPGLYPGNNCGSDPKRPGDGSVSKAPRALGDLVTWAAPREVGKQTVRLDCSLSFEEVAPGSFVPALLLFEGQLSATLKSGVPETCPGYKLPYP